MKTLRIYVDTSVLGGCFDREFAPWSRSLVEDFRQARFKPVFSDVTVAEVQRAPEPVRNLLAELGPLGETIAISPEADELVRAYEDRRILGPRWRNDMLHIALATIAEVDVLVSWNFKHIVRLDRIRLFNAVHLETGYKPIAIYSPREVTTHGEDATDPCD
jgi:hypothetical protein